MLKATHPAMSLDSTFLRRVFGNKGPDGQMTAAYTEVLIARRVNCAGPNILHTFGKVYFD